MAESTQPSTATPSVQVDGLLFRLRWILWLLAFPVAWIDVGGASFPAQLWAWLAVVAIVNLTNGVILRFAPMLAARLPVPALVLDTILFGIPPYLVDSDSNLLAFFAIFPAFVAAVRFGPKIGLAIASALSLLLGAHAFFESSANKALFSLTVFPIIALFAATALTGLLSKQEKEAAVKQAAMELDELRGAMAGAKILYQMSDSFSLTTNYKPVLEAMLEAGVAGLPTARAEDGPPVGIALFFDDQDPDNRLRVAASRNLDRRDEGVRVSGKSGIVAETLQNGRAVVFRQIGTDPELSAFGALLRCRGGVCYPLQSGLEQYGVVVLATPAPRRPSQQHLDLMRAFTAQAAITFQNAKLYQATRKEQDRIIRSDSELRQKLARDLHDGPTQKVSGLVMQLEFISRLLDHDPAEAKRELEKARNTAQQTAKEIRMSLFALRPLALETQGLSAALDQYCKRLREAEDVQITVAPGDFGSELDLNFAATVFAIVEEAVNNARKHAERAPIFVSAARRDNTLIATVQDQGPGFDVDQVLSSYDKRSSLGLQNMRERAQLINGDLRIDSAPGQGTRVTLIAPLPPPSPFETTK